MATVSVTAAKKRFSDLVQRVRGGETVVITAGRNNTPVARLVSFGPVEKKRLGALETPGFVLPATLFEPWSEADI